MGKIFDTTAYANKATPVAADLLALGDSASLTGGVPDNKTISFGQIAANLVTAAGVAGSFTATAPAQTSAAQAGVGITLTASDAVDGSSTHGAANGGTILAIPGANVNSGTDGKFIVRQASGTPGTNEIQIWADANGAWVKSPQGQSLVLQGAQFGATTLVLRTGGAYFGVDAATYYQALRSTQFAVVAACSIGWVPGSNPVDTDSDTALCRSSAGVIELNNGTKGVTSAAVGITIPAPASGAGNTFTITGSAAASGSGANGGSLSLVPGAKDGAGTDGKVRFYNAAATGFMSIQQQTSTDVAINVADGGSGGTLFIQVNGGTQIQLASGACQFYPALNMSNRAQIKSCSDGGGANPVGLVGDAAKVWKVTDGSSGTGWLQNSAGEATLNAAFTDATGTLAATNISFTVIAGRSYRIDGYLIVSNSTAADGFQMNFAGGVATATLFDLSATVEAGGSVVAGTQTSTSLAGVINYTTVTGTVRIHVKGTFKCNAGGTLILQAATNTHVSGTITLAAGSYIDLQDTVRV